MATASPVKIVPNRKRAAHRLTCIPGRSQVRQPLGIVTSSLTPTQPPGSDVIGTGTCRCGQRREYNRLEEHDINNEFEDVATVARSLQTTWLRSSRNVSGVSRVDRVGSTRRSSG